ncbi:sec-independent translocase [Streptomyces sp. B-S-A8]|uniref:Sec-independent protein translocase protein TatB n=1 Tax=Streptomyces solicavernae TaxID=3043614 RepID=A0ABT6RXX7_9ACTN|nr:sec-independent translocase [Streptomyces sp. B-S-A8]MDI3389286.1 sec-independent translocase [Streptomyces sp. B-S-A8]
MFNDIGTLELVTLVVLAVLIFGPDKLPKVIQDISGFIRKIRSFSDSAKRDIRDELGPEFKDFEFEDLNPKAFIRKQLDNDDLGLKEIRNGFDLRKEMTEVSDAVNGHESESVNGSAAAAATAAAASGPSLTKGGDGPDLQKKPQSPTQDERPPYDSDAT